MPRKSDERISVFEQWARSNLDSIHDLPATEAAEELGDALLLVDEQLGVEIEGEISDKREAIITAFSEPSRFSLVERVVAVLADHAGWEFVALKPPRGFDFRLSMGNQDLQACDLEFEPLCDIQGGVRILVDQPLPVPPNEAEELAWLIVETGIGEELAARLRHVEIAVRGKGSLPKPIGDLAGFARQLTSRTR